MNARRAPGWSRALNLAAVADLTQSSRPETRPSEGFRSSGTITPRNLVDTKSATQEPGRPPVAPAVPTPVGCRWCANKAWPPNKPASRCVGPADLSASKLDGPSWTVKSRSVATGKTQALSTMGQALANADASGFQLREGLPAMLELKQPCSEDELRTVLDATYRQLLNRVPTESERLVSAESRLRNQDIDLPDFIAEVAMSEAFQNRIASMAPLRAASAAGLALLGRATTPAETSRFLITRAQAGHGAAVTELLAERISTTVPRIDGMSTASGVSQATIQRTASLYRGNAGLNPPTGDAI